MIGTTAAAQTLFIRRFLLGWLGSSKITVLTMFEK